MVNRRKLIQLILSEIQAERPYFDLKQLIDLASEGGRGKLVRNIAALANSNPGTPSFIIVGIEDRSRRVLGATYVDDARVQQLVRHYLSPRLEVMYEMISYPTSGSELKLGLLTINAAGGPVFVAAPIWKLSPGTRFVRDGSETRWLRPGESFKTGSHEDECRGLLARASVRLEDTLREFLGFRNRAGDSYHPQYAVYGDQHVVCYSGWPDDRFGTKALCEVTVELLTEGVSLFWSALHFVTIAKDSDRFTVCEQALLFWEGEGRLFPFEETSVVFARDGTYSVERTLVFRPPPVSSDEIDGMLSQYEERIEALRTRDPRFRGDYARWETFPTELLIGALNGSAKARDYLHNYLDGRADGAVAEARTEALNLLRRIQESR